MINDKSPLSPFLSRFSNLMVENKVIKFALSGLVFVAVYQQYSINKFFDQQIVVIQPPNLVGEVSVSRNYADEEYLKTMVIYIGNLFINVGASNANKQFSDILKMAHPDSFKKLKEKFKNKSNLLEKYSSISYTGSIQRNRSMIFEKDKVTFYALKQKVVGNVIEKGIPFKIIIDYKFINGTFYILDIKEVEDV